MKLNDLYDRFDETEAILAKIDAEIKKEEKRLKSGVTSNVRKASTVLTAKNGLQIVVSKKNARHYERTVHYYRDNKRAELITGNDRDSINFWKLWLAQEDVKNAK